MSRNPYVGPRTFRTGEELPAREREKRELTDLLIAERIVLLFSPSGAGKTSLIHAGVVPLLKKERFGGNSFQVVLLRVNTPPPVPTVHNRYIYSTALHLLPDYDPKKLEPLTFPEVLDRVKQQPASGIPVLIFDQFEEILTLDPADWKSQEIFFRELGLVLAGGGIWVLFSIREDFYGGLDRFVRHLPGQLQTTYRLDFLTRNAAKIAIQQPARDLGVKFTDEAADKLLRLLTMVKVERPCSGVEETQAPYVVPFQLQVVCRTLWKSLAKEKGAAFNSIEADDVGSYRDIDRALRGYYSDTVMEVAKATEVEEWAIRKWFERQLITEQHFRSQTQTSPAGPWEADKGVLRALEEAYLVRSEIRAGATWYELSHDNLIKPILESNKRAREAPERPAAFGTPTQYGGMLLVLTGHESPPHGVVFSPDGRQLASVSDDGTLRLWDPATRQLISTPSGHAGPVNGVAFSPDGATLASAGGDGTVRLWNAATGDPTAILEGHQDRVRGVVFSPDGRQLASGSSDHTVRLWDPATRELIAILKDHSGVYGVAFSPDGRRLATGGRARTVRLWDPATRELVATLEGHTRFVNGVAFSPGGRQLASVSDDGTLRLWDPATRQLSTSLEGHTGPVLGVAFSPDGRRLATGGDDRTVRLWNVAPNSLIADTPV